MSAGVANGAFAEDAAPKETGSGGLVLWIRSLVLTCSGIFVALTASLHSSLLFDRVTAAVIFGLLAIAFVVEARAARQGQIWLYTLAGAAAVAAALQLVTGSAIVFAVVIAAWAALNVIAELMRARAGAVDWKDARLLAAFALLLSIGVIVFRDDPIATIGFFGAYAVLAGVFLAIAIVDARMKLRESARAAEKMSSRPDSL